MISIPDCGRDRLLIRNGRGGFMENHRNIETDPFATSCASIISGVISVFLSALVMAFHCIFTISYFDILEAKYKWYYGSFFCSCWR